MDVLSQMPQYNSAQEEVVKSIMPSRQFAAPALTRQQKAPSLQPAKNLTHPLRHALVSDKWFQQHRGDVDEGGTGMDGEYGVHPS